MISTHRLIMQIFDVSTDAYDDVQILFYNKLQLKLVVLLKWPCNKKKVNCV